MKKLLLSLVAIVGLTIAANAQSTATDSKNENITVELKDAVELTLTSNANGNAFLFDNVDEYENGLTNLNASTLKVRSNKAWKIDVKANSANFTGGDATTPMPASVLSVGIGNQNFLPLSTTAQDLKTGPRGTNTVAGNFFNVDYKANPGFNYSAGVYVMNVVYTLTQP